MTADWILWSCQGTDFHRIVSTATSMYSLPKQLSKYLLPSTLHLRCHRLVLLDKSCSWNWPVFLPLRRWDLKLYRVFRGLAPSRISEHSNSTTLQGRSQLQHWPHFFPDWARMSPWESMWTSTQAQLSHSSFPTSSHWTAHYLVAKHSIHSLPDWSHSAAAVVCSANALTVSASPIVALKNMPLKL